VDQSKIPEFWGQKSKDTVTAIVFIRKIEDLARTNHWTDTATYANVANGFKGFAREWLFATADMLDWTDAQLTWTNLKPRFQKQFATQTDDKQIIEGLSNLAMGPTETTGELLARITNLMVIIKESYAAYNNKAPEPPTDAQGLGHVGLLENTAKQWTNDTANNMLQFFKMQLFRASLPGDLRKAVAQHDPTTMTLDDMYQVATDTQRESGSKTSKPVSAIQDNSQSDNDDEDEPEDDVAASRETTASRTGTKTNFKDPGNAAIDTPPEMGTTETGMESTASTAKSRIIHRKNAGRELKTINRAKTNKDVPIGLKCK
jgi:hypothetical protein